MPHSYEWQRQNLVKHIAHLINLITLYASQIGTLSSVLAERLPSWAVLSDIVFLLSSLLYIYIWTDAENLKCVTNFKYNKIFSEFHNNLK